MLKRYLFLVIFACALAVPAQDAHDTFPFSVEGPVGVAPNADGTVTFRIEFNGPDGEEYEPVWSWTVTAGEIVSGQGTTEITVTRPEAGGLIGVTARREFGKPHFPGVQKEASGTYNFDAAPPNELIAEMLTYRGNCELLMEHADRFFTAVYNNPASQGYVIVYADPRSSAAVDRQERLLRRYTRIRGFDAARITVVRGGLQRDAKTQFWRVPPGAEPPAVKPDDPLALPVPRTAEFTKPYIYATDAIFNEQPECSDDAYVLAEYSALLKENPGYRGNIVINASSPAEFRAREIEIRAELEKNGLERRRIRTFYKKVADDPMTEFSELWILP